MKNMGIIPGTILCIHFALLTGCSKQPEASEKTGSAESELAAKEALEDKADKTVATKVEEKAAKPTAEAAEKPEAEANTEPGAPMAGAQVGSAAPDFTLKDLDGKEISLASFKGKTVVLEWFNPECPFVQKSHTKGSLSGSAKRHADAGVVWLAINSGAKDKQGHGAPLNLAAKTKYNLAHPVLLDEDGAVGKAYGATNTPHLFVINDQGVLVYRGAIDNSPDGEGASPKDGKLVNYVDEALAALKAGKPIATSQTEAYGCGVKYAD